MGSLHLPPIGSVTARRVATAEPRDKRELYAWPVGIRDSFRGDRYAPFLEQPDHPMLRLDERIDPCRLRVEEVGDLALKLYETSGTRSASAFPSVNLGRVAPSASRADWANPSADDKYSAMNRALAALELRRSGSSRPSRWPGQVQARRMRDQLAGPRLPDRQSRDRRREHRGVEDRRSTPAR